jgi:hypothetical protein
MIMKKMYCLFISFVCLASVQAKSFYTDNANQVVRLVSDSSKLVVYVGRYNFKPNEMVQSVELTIEKGTLLCTTNDKTTYKFEEVEDKQDIFNIPALGAEVVFVRDVNKKVIGLKVNVQGGDLLADKEETKK